jgi:hypothetical protein
LVLKRVLVDGLRLDHTDEFVMWKSQNGCLRRRNASLHFCLEAVGRADGIAAQKRKLAMVGIVARIGHNVLLAALAFVNIALFLQVI